jgi:hypothetical protein
MAGHECLDHVLGQRILKNTDGGQCIILRDGDGREAGCAASMILAALPPCGSWQLSLPLE